MIVEMAEVNLTVNGEGVVVPAGTTVLQACEVVGVEIPRFCYHERLRVAGNCRRCLVEVVGSPKPVASCARPVGEGRDVVTTSPLVEKAREGVREFLLRQHPLDCPICDQGGECDLQDQSRIYGSDRSRYRFPKRGVEDKERGPIVKTVRTRCIQCTRCVRFAAEIAGVADLGATGRGTGVEIGTYVKKARTSELSGNLVDICPVGALTAKPTAFRYRSWELEGTEGVDQSDALGSSVQRRQRQGRLQRLLPVTNDDINGAWLSDKGRYRHEGWEQTLTRGNIGGDVVQGRDWSEFRSARLPKRGSSWEQTQQRGERVVGGSVDLERIQWLSEWFRHWFGADLPVRTRSQDAVGVKGGEWQRSVEQVRSADLVLLVGCDPRRESAVFNSILREVFLRGARVRSVGGGSDPTYPLLRLGTGSDALAGLLKGEGVGAESLLQAERPLVIRGSDRDHRSDAVALEGRCRQREQLLASYGARERGWKPLRKLPRFSNAVGQQRRFDAQPIEAAEVSTSVDLQLLVGVSESERERAGWTVDELKTRANLTLVVTNLLEGWELDRGGVRPRPLGLDYRSAAINREGRYQSWSEVTHCGWSQGGERSDLQQQAELTNGEVGHVSSVLGTTAQVGGFRGVPGVLSSSREDAYLEGHPRLQLSKTLRECSRRASERASNWSGFGVQG